MSRAAPGSRFEELLGRLEEIVKTLESEELDLERSVALFEEGMDLAGRCHRKLDEAERRVEILRRKPSGDLETEPFEPVEGE